MSEQFANNAISTLTSSMDNVTTSALISSVSYFPPVGNFRIIVDSEIMKVTSVSSTNKTFTVVRGQEGTTAASHSNGATVACVVTSGALSAFRSDNVVVDTYANQPTAGRAGTLFVPNNSLYFQHDNGASWDTFAPLWGGITVPTSGNFAWQNQGSATVSTTNGYTYFVSPGTGAYNVVGRNINAPSTPYHAIFAWTWQAMSQTIFDSDYRTGPYWTDGTKLITVNSYLGSGGGSVIRISKFATVTDASPVDYFSLTAFNSLSVTWYRIGDDGSGSSSARTVDFSVDGVNWQNAWSSSRTDFLTPTKIGFQITTDASSSTTTITAAWLHYSTTT